MSRVSRSSSKSRTMGGNESAAPSWKEMVIFGPDLWRGVELSTPPERRSSSWVRGAESCTLDPTLLGPSEFEPRTEPHGPRVLIRDHPTEVRIRHLERDLGVVVIIQHALLIEQVERVSEHHQAPCSEPDAVVAVHIEIHLHGRPGPEALLGLHASAARRLRNFSGAVVDGIRRKSCERSA